MNRRRAFLVVLGAAVALAHVARAEDAPPPRAEGARAAPPEGAPPAEDRPAAAPADAARSAPAAPQQAATDPARPPHVRASHRVDVIAPGERVETIIDRMRSERTAQPPPREPKPVPRPSGAGPDRRRDRDRPGPDDLRGPRDLQIGGPGARPPLPPPPPR